MTQLKMVTLKIDVVDDFLFDGINFADRYVLSYTSSSIRQPPIFTNGVSTFESPDLNNWSLIFDDFNGTVFSSDALPLTPPNLSEFELKEFSIVLADVSGNDPADRTIITAGIDSLTVAAPLPELVALSPAQVWIGLKNSDAVGLRLDVHAEVLLNGATIGEGQLDNVASGSSGFQNAKLHTIPSRPSAPVEVPAEAELEITLSVRRTCFGKGHNSGTPRLWFNDSQANSHFGATIADTTSASSCGTGLS